MSEQQSEQVTLTIDGQQVTVPKGTNLIEAAKKVHTDVPYYCYHPDLSIAGNCRMCQVEVEGRPKLEVACNTAVQEGMVVRTQKSSEKVRDAQAATLEFILINHPLDCTVCDQAGHCKLQDYHYDHNARPSRFLENKVHKPKAKPLGPTVMLDAERCIMCTRCVRFCEEITKTRELGMANRGDRTEIIVHPGNELNNPLSGCVVDLCPVGALTHKNWRFNTRIWFTDATDTVCPGCSTGCSAKVYSRDNEIVQVKGRFNQEVNHEWLCDEGRYGFNRFLPKVRLVSPMIDGREASFDEAAKKASAIKGKVLLVFVSPDLLMEEQQVLKNFLDREAKSFSGSVAYRERTLSKVEEILVSPDYAANFRGAQFTGLASQNPGEEYKAAIQKLRAGSADNVLIVGERAILAEDIDEELCRGLRKASMSVAILTDGASPLVGASKVVLPGRSILEKSGLLMNRDHRVQYSSALVTPPKGSEADWQTIQKLAAAFGKSLVEAKSDRELTLSFLKNRPELSGKKIQDFKQLGVSLNGKAPLVAEKEQAKA